MAGSVFYEALPVGARRNAFLDPPELVIDTARLGRIALATGLVEHATNYSAWDRQLAYRLYITEVGEASVESSRSKIPEVETELARTRVISPARYRSDPVPVTIVISIPIPSDR